MLRSNGLFSDEKVSYGLVWQLVRRRERETFNFLNRQQRANDAFPKGEEAEGHGQSALPRNSFGNCAIADAKGHRGYLAWSRRPFAKIETDLPQTPHLSITEALGKEHLIGPDVLAKPVMAL